MSLNAAGMNCPKCQGGAYLAEEDAVKVVEGATPLVLIIKQTFACRACGDKYSRIVVDDADARRNPPPEQRPYQPPEQRPYQPPATMGAPDALDNSVIKVVSMAGDRPPQRPQGQHRYEREPESEKIQFLD